MLHGQVLHCKLPGIGKQLPSFSNRFQGLNYIPQTWEVSVLPMTSRKPLVMLFKDAPLNEINLSKFISIFVKKESMKWFKFKKEHINNKDLW